MSQAVSPVAPDAPLSTLEAAGLPKLWRREVVEFELAGTLSAAVLKKRHYIGKPGRIVGISSFRRTAASGVGAADSTDVDVNLNGTSVLSATIQHENASGNNDRLLGLLDSAHAAHDGYGVVVAPGDYLEVQIDAIEAGGTAPSGLFVQIDLMNG